MISACKTAARGKVPLHFMYLFHYIVNCLGIDPDHIERADYDSLVKAAFVVLCWNTMCRPGVIYTKKLTDPANPTVKMITGPKWKHISIRHLKGYMSKEVTRIRIPWYKNQPVKGVPKDITMCSVLCGKPKEHCVCSYMESSMYIREIRRRRVDHVNHPERFRRDSRPLTQKQIDGLALGPDNFLLVNSNGTVYGRSNADRILKELISFIGCDKSVYNLTVYSLRVGVTSAAHHQDIDALKIMRFVQWVCNPDSDPSMHARYVKFTLQQLATVPFEVLHGTLRHGPYPVNMLLDGEPEFFDVTAKSVKAAIYDKSSSHSKGRRHPC